ncbi:NAD(P)-dependent dehydrogenase (short-subunit alcohol dehydrogenase family) [Elusimicrobium posterum]|uniref:SDR family oxidoreductase n=1 Tax=Elusimicrobium posterum TaxID=3116653 RepID=UPI003C749EB9
MEWSKKVAVISGASGVLLGAFAKELASKGTKIAILSRKIENAQPVIDEITAAGGTAKAYKCDVLDKESLTKAEEQIFADFGEYHILINGAGGNMDKANTTNEVYSDADVTNPDVRSFFDLDPEVIQTVFSLNVMGAFITTQVFAKRMVNVKGATIINVSSMAAEKSLTKVLGYSAAKSALDNLTKWLAVHFANKGLRVNAVAPGFFVTNQNRNLLKTADGGLTPRSNKIISHTPMGRFGEVSDLFGAFLWLCDEDASGFVTGVVVPVDGGFSAYGGV